MQNLNNWFNDLNKLIQDSYITYKNLSVITEMKSETEFLNKDFFNFFQYQQWFMLNIQLSKIFANKPDTQKRNIISLCNNIIKGDYVEEFQYMMQESSRTNFTYIDFIEKAKKLKKKLSYINPL